MELRQIRHFLSIARSGSFSKAAAEHGLTQQALSKSIQTLEEGLGVRLFDRDTRMVRPTLFGELLLRYAANVDGELRGFQQALDGLLGRGLDRLAIGAGPAGAGDIVGRAVLETVKRRPRLRCVVKSGRYDTLLPDLLRGEIDLFVTLMTEEAVDPLLAHEILSHEDYGVVASARHPLAAARSVGLADLAGHPWLSGLNLGAVLDRVRQDFAAAGLELPAATVQTDSPFFVRLALAETDMLAILPLGTVRMEIELGRLTVIDVPEAKAWSRPLAVFWRAQSTRSADALALIAQLRGLAGGRRKADARPGRAGQKPPSSSTSS